MSIKWTGEDLHDWQLATNGARRVREWFMIGLFCLAIVIALLLSGCNVDLCADVKNAVGYRDSDVTDGAILFDAKGRTIGAASLEHIAECANK